MKKLVLVFVMALGVTVSKAGDREVIAEVIFENLTEKEAIAGDFYVIETKEKISVNTFNRFKITLPKKGKYHFRFVSEGFSTYTYYPNRITNNRNTITIRLMKKRDTNFQNDFFSFPMDMETTLTDEEIEQKIEKGTLNFISHGIDATIPEEYVRFKEKYGIGLVKENCVIDPAAYKKATENNQMIVNFLTKKFGEKRQQRLPILVIVALVSIISMPYANFKGILLKRFPVSRNTAFATAAPIGPMGGSPTAPGRSAFCTSTTLISFGAWRIKAIS